MKKDQKFNTSMSWTGYKRESKKEDSKSSDQTDNNYYSTLHLEYEISRPIENDLDALTWDKDINFNILDSIPNLDIYDV